MSEYEGFPGIGGNRGRIRRTGGILSDGIAIDGSASGRWRTTIGSCIFIGTVVLTGIFSRRGGVSGGEGVCCRSVRGVYERVGRRISKIGGIRWFTGTGSVDISETSVSRLVISAITALKDRGRIFIGTRERSIVTRDG